MDRKEPWWPANHGGIELWAIHRNAFRKTWQWIISRHPPTQPRSTTPWPTRIIPSCWIASGRQSHYVTWTGNRIRNRGRPVRRCRLQTKMTNQPFKSDQVLHPVFILFERMWLARWTCKTCCLFSGKHEKILNKWPKDVAFLLIHWYFFAWPSCIIIKIL